MTTAVRMLELTHVAFFILEIQSGTIFTPPNGNRTGPSLVPFLYFSLANHGFFPQHPIIRVPVGGVKIVPDYWVKIIEHFPSAYLLSCRRLFSLHCFPLFLVWSILLFMDCLLRFWCWFLVCFNLLHDFFRAFIEEVSFPG